MISQLEIRKFTDMGIAAFRTYLDTLRTGTTVDPPYELLTGPKTSRPIDANGWVEQKKFETRLDAARYLHKALSDIDEDNIENDVHLWSWLSLFYFDQVCPLDKAGIRKPGRDYRHILEPGYPFGHRHLIGGTYLVYTVYGCGEGISRLLLCTPLSVESRLYHQLAVRQSFITNKGIMEAAYRLYFDRTTQKVKRGAQRIKSVPGTLFRFIDVIQQLDLNYDLYSMSGGEVLELLPAEFDKWKG